MFLGRLPFLSGSDGGPWRDGGLLDKPRRIKPGTKLPAILFIPVVPKDRPYSDFGNVRFQVLGACGAGVGIRGLSVGPDGFRRSA
jgi:hypothetical protein